MTLPTNDDFAIRELSIEELEAIAGGGVWGWIKHEASAAVHWAESPGLKILENIFGRVPGPKIPPYL